MRQQDALVDPPPVPRCCRPGAGEVARLPKAAKERPGLTALLGYARRDDTVLVYRIA